MLNMPSQGEFGRVVVGVATAGVQMLSYLGERYAAVYLNSVVAAAAAAAAAATARTTAVGATFMHQIQELGASAAAAATGTKAEQSCRSVKV